MFAFAQTQTNPLRQAITAAYRRDEEEAVADMLQRAAMSAEEKQAADQLARSLVKKCVPTAAKPAVWTRSCRNSHCPAKKAWR